MGMGLSHDNYIYWISSGTVRVLTRTYCTRTSTRTYEYVVSGEVYNEIPTEKPPTEKMDSSSP